MQMNNTQPQVILLNGPSSAGKSTLAKALIEAMEREYVFRDVGQFCCLISSRQRQTMSKVKDVLVAGDCGFLAAGFGVVVEVISKSEEEWNDWLHRYNGYRIFTIGVHANREVCEKREIERGNRAIGHHKRTDCAIPTSIAYDLILDTSSKSPQELAAEVIEIMAQQPHAADGEERRH